MPTAAAPENAMTVRRKVRVAEGLINRMVTSNGLQVACLTYKLRLRLSVPQSSKTIEATVRIGIHNRLL